jgi:enamine deaminase RidA (YjgF/YER057c/UK114 family)
MRLCAFATMLACCAFAMSASPHLSPTGIQYVPLDAPPGMSQAVIVRGEPLVHTRQLVPLDKEGRVVAAGSADRQIEQVLDNLAIVLKDSGSGMDKLVRVNVYALSTKVVPKFVEHLAKRLGPSVRPAITSVLTPLPDRAALIAVDAVAAAAGSIKSVALHRCPYVAGNGQFADAAVLPAGSIAYLSGQPDESTLTASAVSRSMTGLMKTLDYLKLSPKQVVQIKVFLRPASSAEEVLREIRPFFPNQITPPVVFVEWLAAVPAEIEMIARYPYSADPPPSDPVVFVTPPESRPSNTFSKVALLQTDTQIYISGLYAAKPSRGEPQAVDLFGRLQDVLSKTGSDMRHLVKATYYVSDDDAARWVDRTRPRVFDPARPPAASKVMVHGVGLSQRTMTVDMIAVPARP